MSSSTSDSLLNAPKLNGITGYISHIQQKNIFTKERFRSTRQFFFQLIGLTVLLYWLCQLLFVFYLLVKLIFHLMFTTISWLPVKILELCLPNLNNYYILFPLFWFCSLISFFIARFSHKNIEIYLEKRSQVLKRYSFIFTLIVLLLLQSLFILLPVTTSIQGQRKLSSSPLAAIKILSEKEIVKTNLYIKQARELNDNKREDYNKTQLSSSREGDLKLESDIEDDRNVVAATDLRNKVKTTPPDELKEKKKISSSESQLELEQISTFRQKFNSWLHEAWLIWHQTTLDFQELFSTSRKQTYDVSRYGVSSIYTAFVDLSCYDYTRSIYHYKLFKQKYNHFLNTYRQQSPFPVYLSILKSNGPICYRQYSTPSCAINSKLFFPNFKTQLYRFAKFWIFLSLSIIILQVIYKALGHRLAYTKPNLSSNKTQQITSDKTNNLSSQKISSDTTNKHSLDKKIEEDLRFWLEFEQNEDYANLKEICRIALNDTFSKEYEGLNIESLQFANAKIHHISQLSVDPTVINAILDIDHVIFNIKDEYYSIEMRKLTGELEVSLINRLNEYSIEVKFKQIQIDCVEIIDSKNVSSSYDKQSIINLLKETISQTIVQCSFHLLDSQENIVNEFQTQPYIPPSVSQSSNIFQECETPLIAPIKEHNEQKTPIKDIKKLLIRIVKAVNLHDVEQPFCTLELNQPKQIHQTSIAKNGLNPFWDERFVFDCNDKSNQLRLQIIDRKKPNKKLNNSNTDTIYADVLIPFSYVTSTTYKQDVRITPQHPDSIIRVEFSTLSEEEALIANNEYDNESIIDSQTWSIIGREENQIQLDNQQDEISYNPDGLRKDANNTRNYTSTRSQRTTDTFVTLSPLSPDNDDNVQRNQPRKSRSFIYSLRHLTFARRKKHNKKGNHVENGVISPFDNTIQTNSIAHSVSAEPFISTNTTGATAFPRGSTITQSFRNLFRSNSKKRTSVTNNFIMDHPDLLSTSTPTRKKRSFFRHFKPKHKQQINVSTNSLTSYDCTRSASVRNTPVRANGGRPVTMTRTLVQ